MFKINFMMVLFLACLVSLSNCQIFGKSENQPETASPNKATSTIVPKKLIRLNEDNAVTLRGLIDELTTSNFLTKLLSLPSNEIYIYLVTPGGSVTHGSQIISAIESLTQQGKKISCIADVAASMGFVITQACPVRYVRSNSILMQHQMSLGLKGPLEQIKSRLNFTNQMNDYFERMQYERLKMTEKEFFDLVNNDWWMYGDMAVSNRVADEVVNVACSQELLKGRYTQTVHTFFGSFDLVFSQCSLIRDPLEVKFDNVYDKVGLLGYIEENKEKYYISEFINKGISSNA